MSEKFDELLCDFARATSDYAHTMSVVDWKKKQASDLALMEYVTGLEDELARLREENALIRAQLNEVLLWHPFSEQRPPEDESRYATRYFGDKKYWCWLPPLPEVK